MLSVTMAGLNAAQKSMDVTSNNMANSNTVGFKRSTAVFGDVFSSDPASNPKTAVGSGVMTSSVSRDTTAGAVKTTGRVTDLAIDGRGYFVVQDPSPGAPMTFTRAGNFGLDAHGFIVDASGNQLLGFTAQKSIDAKGNPIKDANGNIVMEPSTTSAALQVQPQYLAGSTLPDGTQANQEIQQINFSGPALTNNSIVIAGTQINFAVGESPQVMADRVVQMLQDKVANKVLTAVTPTGSNNTAGVIIGYPWTSGAQPSTIGQPILSGPSAKVTVPYEPSDPMAAVETLNITKNSLISGDQYSFTVPALDQSGNQLSLSVNVTVPGDPSNFVATLNSAILEAGDKAGAAVSSLPNVVEGPTSADNLSSFDFEWADSTKLPSASKVSAKGADSNDLKGAVIADASTTAPIPPGVRKIQTITFPAGNAPMDMDIVVAGTTISVSKGDSPTVISNAVAKAIQNAYPGQVDIASGPPDLTITFDPSLKDAKLIRPIYNNKKTTATVSELAKYSTDPVLMQGVSIDSKGQLAATYSNGSTYTMGFLELANFANDSGLKDIGGNRFVQTGTSGQPVITAAGAPKAGNIMSGALEQANVDITSELMDMIRAQQVYNGNARVLQTTVDTVTKITDLR